MGTAERRTRQRSHGSDRRHLPAGHAAVRADEHPFGAWHRHVTWDHSAAVRNGRSHGADHGRPGRLPGWHSHPGGAIIIVKEGALTVYSPVGHQCRTTTYSAGQAFIERPGEVDDVLNTGTVPYVLYVTFPRVPQGGSARIDQPDPGTCPGI